MKKVGKNQPGPDSYSVTEAAAALGVSTPTLKRMVAEGRLESFRTPGGHLRILAESLESVRDNRQGRSRPVGNASPVLQNRRERLEELTLEAQEHRARRELTKLQREEQEEAEQREAEAQAREEEAEQRRAEIALERERLAHEKAEDRRRQEREEAAEEARLEAERELAGFRGRWYALAAQAVATQRSLHWLSAGQRKEMTDGLESEIDRRRPGDEPRMAEIMARTLAALVEPLEAARDAQDKRQRATRGALWELPVGATEAERLRATSAIRDAIARLDPAASETEVRAVAQEAMSPVKQAVEKRLLDERLLLWAASQLPWGKTDSDEARVRRECAEILAELPLDVSEVEGKEALRPTVAEARREIVQRQAEKERLARKGQLVELGVAEVRGYMLKLEHEGEITSEECWDTDFAEQLRTVVCRSLEADLTGGETNKEVQERARRIIDGELA